MDVVFGKNALLGMYISSILLRDRLVLKAILFISVYDWIYGNKKTTLIRKGEQDC